ncbi:glycosyltransferase family 2 protein [Cylindrospermum sp. FACHB-282]|uniref:glycosyltransferase family 2 protein n=1 Tax=Cylindrospermum sp. FACHB-282 TaxID=2692794 RepID=UPI001685AB99|nr:glycosyltransferase family A protein [Cylindrospermum sp. FACHB-282]MBD2387215.1 glycosyltransferase family 2 protein [Cylindrospermum sp. FACHB-282]
MDTQPLVSGIIIFLNEEKFIQEAIESVFAQTYKNWELLLVDDGSVDSSTDIARRFAEEYPDKVRYLEHENHQNRGMSASRNLGIQKAEGEYIAFLDGDDIWLPKKLEQQVNILNSESSAAMVYGRTEIWYSWAKNSDDSQEDHFYDLGVQPNTLVPSPQLLLLLLKNKCQTPTTCNVLVRRKVFVEVGQFEEVFRGMYEDQVFFTKVLLKFPVFVANDCWARYRQHPATCSANEAATKAYMASRLKFLLWVESYFSAQGIEHQEIWETLKKEIWDCQNPTLSNLTNSIKYFIWRMKEKVLHTISCKIPVSISRQ